MAEDKDMAGLARRWSMELDLSKRQDQKWVQRAKKIVKRYRDERGATDSDRKYNILWSNVQTILPAIYAKTPKAEAVRRNKDSDPAARCAAEILERSLQYEIEQYDDFDEAMAGAVLDRLLGGRGTVWVRFEEDEHRAADGTAMSRGRTPVDYVYWEDFRCSPARVWGEVTWVARRVYMSRADGVERFGDVFKEVPLTHEPIGLDDMKDRGASQGETDSMKKAQVWEIWDKPSKQVIWVSEGFDRALDVKDDLYGLDEFWPCPKPIFATQTTDTLEPVPDYSMYQDQAREMDMLTHRIGMLVEAVKVVGVYDASQTGLQRMLSEGVNNTMIPVDNWAMLAEKGGIKGVVDWFPLEQVIKALQQCYMSLEAAKAQIYEITGISDIIRGDTQASETATAQSIKRQFGSLRLRPRQRDVAVFASSILRIKAQLMMDFYTPEALLEMSGIENTAEDPSVIPQALQLLKSEPLRAYRVEVASDSLVELDEEQEKQARVEFLGAAGQFLERSLPVAQAVPQLAPLIGEMLMFGVRAFKAGRPIEAAFDQAVQALSQPQAEKPDPEMAKAQGEQQLAQAKLEADARAQQMKLQADQAIQQARMDADMRIQQMRIGTQSQLEQQRAQMQADLDRIKHEAELRHKAALAQQEMEFNRWKAELDAATRIEIANISSAAKVDNPATQAATNEIASEVQQ